MKPSLAKGTRDFTATEVRKRQYVIDILRNNFQHYGYQPLETPTFENLSTLTGKYGKEGDRLIFKILNSGDFLEKINDFQKENYKTITPKISDKALRYDLTVPFARFVAMHYGQLIFPYKRYQIQPVWRADRPQKGRYREFYQCDADVVGSESLWQEIELLQLYITSFRDLKIPVKIHFNNRKILSGLATYAEITDQLIDFTVALDKLDKIGKNAVINELKSKNISDQSISKLAFLFEEHNQDELLKLLKINFKNDEIGQKGIEELAFVMDHAAKLGLKEQLIFDITLARGLDYYTGAIFEVKADNIQMGSVGGGGRYNNLTEVFGVKNIPGIGISFGLDRICLVMEELGLFPENLADNLDYLFANFGDTEAAKCMEIISKLHEKGFSAELYPEMGKMKKFFSYAEKRGVDHLVFLGEEELKTNTIKIKNQKNGEQQSVSIQEFLAD